MSKYEEQLIATRYEKLEKLRSMGIDPYGRAFGTRRIPYRDGQAGKLDSIYHVLQYPEDEDEPARIAGRIISRNNKGKLKFFFVKDETEKIQIMISKKDVSEEVWNIVECMEVGDIVGIDGIRTETNTGEPTIFVKSIHWLTKSVAVPPEKFHKIKDEEILQRKRYLDLIYTDGAIEQLKLRSKVISDIRKFLSQEGREFIEVETPILQSQAGGAAARPFTTHHNALDQDFNLRIALELHLKRLLVGGLERVYEIGRVFRNEGIDHNHNPEFTMLELYEAYSDYQGMEKLLINLMGYLTNKKYDYQKISFSELIYNEIGVKLGKDDIPVQNILGEPMPYEGSWLSHCHAGNYAGYYIAANYIFDKIIQPKLIKPTLVYDYPSQICPLTKRCEDPKFAQRFEFFVNGMEIANAYTELNDPAIQEDNFRKQLLELPEEERMGKIDDDFIEALKVGMPPAGGIGIGIDRLVMLLADAKSIKDVIVFPTLREKY